MIAAPVLLLMAAVALAAQQPQPVQPPTFRAEANLVRVDVTVVDRHGEPVTTLAAADFAVEEDGVAQTVQSFKFVSADGHPPPGDDLSLAIRSPEHAAAEAARDEVRVFVIFWDEYHIDRFAEAIKGRKALSEFVSTAFGMPSRSRAIDGSSPTRSPSSRDGSGSTCRREAPPRTT